MQLSIDKNKLEEFKRQAQELGFTIQDQKPTTDKPKVEDHPKEKPKETEDKSLRRSSGFYAKKKVANVYAYGDSLYKIIVRELEGIDCDGAPILTGFPSTSLASILSGGYLREKLQLPLIGVISSHGFPPRCIIEKGIPSHSVRIFGNKKVVVVLCEFKIPTPELTHTLAAALLDFATRHNAPMLLTVEGMPGDQRDPDTGEIERSLRFISTSKPFSEKLLESGHKPLEEAVVGSVTGALLAEGTLGPMHVSCLLTPGSGSIPDASSAVTVVKTVVDYINDIQDDKIQVDTAPLEDKASELHSTLENIFKSEKEVQREGLTMFG